MSLLGLAGWGAKMASGGLLTWGLAGAALVGLGAWGAVGHYRLAGARADLAEAKAAAADQRAADQATAREFMARNMISRSVADAAVTATQQRLDGALKEIANARRTSFTCPPGVSVWDLRVPGIADELRRIHAADASPGGGDAGAAVEAVPAASAPGR